MQTAIAVSTLLLAIMSFADTSLPNPLLDHKGNPISDSTSWENHRKALLETFGKEMYGVTPNQPSYQLESKLLEEKQQARNGLAIRSRIKITARIAEKHHSFEMLTFLPSQSKTPCPIIIALNFDGNYTIIDDADIPLPSHWVNGLFDNQTPENKAPENARGKHIARWQVDTLMRQGIGLATICASEIEPDTPNRIDDSVRKLFPAPGKQDWGTIGAWSWGLSRGVDVLEKDARIDKKRIIVAGFSRMGKAALWAAAQDTRFAACISNGSGAGGAALSKRPEGETVHDLVTRFPHWFCENFST